MADVGTFYQLHLNQEKPRLGTGHRIVCVTSEDSRFVRVRDPSTGTTARFSKKEWHSINPNPVRYRKKFIGGHWKKNAPKAWRKIHKAAA